MANAMSVARGMLRIVRRRILDGAAERGASISASRSWSTVSEVSSARGDARPTCSIEGSGEDDIVISLPFGSTGHPVAQGTSLHISDNSTLGESAHQRVSRPGEF